MNFFERQHDARRKTGLLMFYCVLAVVLSIVVLNGAIYFASVSGGKFTGGVNAWLQEPYWLLIAGVTVGVVSLGSLISFLQLRGGGRSLAEMVKARRLNMNSRDPDEQRFINVVEEMSIASGTPVPELYIMGDEMGINAFVAGYRPTEAVMLITRGSLERLSRDELQGVVGHKYSHISNGDMRINIRLIAALAGILLLGQLGGFLLRSMRYPGGGRSSGRGGAGRYDRVCDRSDTIRGWLRGRFFRPFDQGGGLSPTGVPGRCFRGSIHAQSRRYR